MPAPMRFGPLAIALSVVAAVLAFIADEGLREARADDSAAHASKHQLDVFSIAQSRTMFLPAPPAGKVTVQLLATPVDGALPGAFKFYLAADDMNELFKTVSEPKGTVVPRGQEMENGIAFVEPGKFYTVQIIYDNPSDEEARFLVTAPTVDPAAALPFARARCLCAAIPFSVRGGGTFSRTIEVGVGPETPAGAKAIVEWPVVVLKS